MCYRGSQLCLRRTCSPRFAAPASGKCLCCSNTRLITFLPSCYLLALAMGHDDGPVCLASMKMRSAGAISKRMQVRRQQLSRRLLRLVPQWPPLLTRPPDSNPRHAPQTSLRQARVFLGLRLQARTCCIPLVLHAVSSPSTKGTVPLALVRWRALTHLISRRVNVRCADSIWDQELRLRARKFGMAGTERTSAQAVSALTGAAHLIQGAAWQLAGAPALARTAALTQVFWPEDLDLPLCSF